MGTKRDCLTEQLECLRCYLLDCLDECDGCHEDCRIIAAVADCLRVYLDWIELQKLRETDALWNELEQKADACTLDIEHWHQVLKDQVTTVEGAAQALKAVAGLVKPFIA